MGWFDFLRGGSEPSDSQIRRAVKQVTQPHGDPAIRLGGLDRLRGWGTPAAIAGLLRRFTIQTSSGQVDNEECQQVEAMLVELGERAVEPIVAFLRREASVAYPARALQQILPTAEYVDRILSILAQLEPGFGSSNSQREGLLRALDEVDDPRIAPALRPFLSDPSDDVVIAALDCILRTADESFKDDLIDLLEACRDRVRVRLEVADRLVALGWVAGDQRKRLEANLPEGFHLDKKGRVIAA